MASIRRTTRCQLMAHLLIKTWYRRIGRPKLNTSEANYYQEQLRNGIPAEAGPNETSRLLGSQRVFFFFHWDQGETCIQTGGGNLRV